MTDKEIMDEMYNMMMDAAWLASPFYTLPMIVTGTENIPDKEFPN